MPIINEHFIVHTKGNTDIINITKQVNVIKMSTMKMWIIIIYIITIKNC